MCLWCLLLLIGAGFSGRVDGVGVLWFRLFVCCVLVWFVMLYLGSLVRLLCCVLLVGLFCLFFTGFGYM